MRRLSRAQLRRRNTYRADVVNQPALQIDHDPVALMAAIDRLPRRFRDVINERGIEQDVYDKLPLQAQIQIGNALGADDESDRDAASVWDD